MKKRIESIQKIHLTQRADMHLLDLMRLTRYFSAYMRESCDRNFTKLGSSPYFVPTKHKVAIASLMSGGTTLNNITTSSL